MQHYLSEIKKALDAKLYILAITSALALPDICARLESTNPDYEKGVGSKYKQWYKKNAESNCFLSPELCYKYRCSMLHQYSSNNPKSKFKKIAFFLPSLGGPKFNNCGFQINLYDEFTNTTRTDEATVIEIDDFVNGMIKSVEDWLQIIKDNKNYKKNISYLVQPRPNSALNAIKGDVIIY